MNTFVSFLMGLLMAWLVAWVAKCFENPKKEILIKAAVAGVVVAVGNYIGYETSSPIIPVATMYMVLLAAMVYAVYWWNEDGSTIKELLLMLFADLIVMATARTCALRFIDVAPWFIAGILRGIPKALAVVSIGFFIADRIWFKESLKIDEALEGGD